MENILLHKPAIRDSKIQLPGGYVSFEEGGGKNVVRLSRPSGEKGEMAPPHLQHIVYSVSNWEKKCFPSSINNSHPSFSNSWWSSFTIIH